MEKAKKHRKIILLCAALAIGLLVVLGVVILIIRIIFIPCN